MLEYLSLAAIILGVILAFIAPGLSEHFAFMGRIFLLLLKVLILPIIVLSLFLAIAKLSDIALLKKLGLRTIAYYLLSSSLAVISGLILANVFILKSGSIDVSNQAEKTGVRFHRTHFYG